MSALPQRVGPVGHSIDPQKHASAILNILEDFARDKAQLEETERAIVNLLEDFSEDKGRFEQTQRAMLNVLGDLSGDKARLEETQHAILNFLEDFAGDKGRLEQSQRAMLNLLEDFDAERLRSEDVSRELRESVQQLRLANEAVESSNKELEAFSYSVSHDLRAPLRHILGFTDILNEECGPALPPEAQHHIERIQQGSRRMAQLIDDLLSLSRLGRQGLRFQISNLREIVEEVIAELTPETEGRSVDWSVQELPSVSCDPGLIRQVFQNLLSNALKFTRTRPQTVIQVGQTRQNGDAVIFVRDNGVGFNPKYSSKLFGVFQRLHRSEEFEGTGIGLATVQRIIHKHGGRIWAEAELDKGASFYFTLGSSQSSEANSKAVAAGEKS